MSTYQETIDYLYERLPMFTRIGAAAYKKDLHNTWALSEAFGHPERKFKSIHIAGTNGKGSTSHMLAAIFQTAGYKTGLYTSPHLKDLRERIKVNGEMIPRSALVALVERSKPLVESIQPSFFELMVVMAYEYFAAQQVDIAIIETGLGGRLDSTNIITPELSIITNIGWDHMNLLGDSLDKIAYEKAGIIKHKVPVVIGEVIPETRDVFHAKADQEDAPICFAETEMTHTPPQLHADRIEAEFTYVATGQSIDISCDLPGLYQLKNIKTVLTAVDLLQKQGHRITPDMVQQALGHVKQLTGLHGRWEVIRDQPMTVLDVGHNVDGMQQVLQQIETIRHTIGQVRFIIGMVKDKEVEKVLQLLPTDAHYYFTNAHLPRAMVAIDLQEKASIHGLKGDSFDDVNEALQQALQVASPKDLIVVCGSVFVVGEVDLDRFK